MATLAYGLVAAAVFTALATATLRDDIPAPAETQGVKESDAFAADAAPGYRDTFLDGGGGIAGVPLTEEQRKAIIREAKRRELSTGDAYALAYGDNAVVDVREDGTVEVETEGVTVPNGPDYAKLPVTATTSRKAVTAPAAGDGEKASAGSASTSPKGSKKDQTPGKGKGKGAAKGKSGKTPPSSGTPSSDRYYPSTGESFYDDEAGLKDALPAPLDKVVDGMSVFTLWLDAASPGTPESIGTVEADILTMVVEAPLSPDMTLTTTLTTPLDGEPQADPVVTSVVTHTATGEVLAEKTGTCPNVHAVPMVAIGQSVDVVLEAREELPTRIAVQSEISDSFEVAN
ncbi:hypothetical protein [Streptomyces sp. NPDC055749]